MFNINSFNYVRAESLQIFSLEFLSILFLIFSIIVFRKKGLICVLAMTLPFTDQVYKIFGFSLSDFFVFIIIVNNINYVRDNYVKLALFGVLAVFGSIICIFIYDDFVPVLFSFRFLMVFSLFCILKKNLENEKIRNNFLWGYKYIYLYSVIFASLQYLFWWVGFEVAGAFYLDGILRVKGLAHEPATFACWLVLGLPIIFTRENNRVTINYYLFSAFFIGMIITLSATAIIVFVVIFIVSMIYMLKYNRIIFVRSILISLFVLPVFLFVFGAKIQEQALPKVSSYFMEIVDGSKENNSGRGGDRRLVEYLIESPLVGIGMFRSTRVGNKDDSSEDFISGTNFYITTMAEWGYFLGTILIFSMIFWIFSMRRFVDANNYFWFASVIGWCVMVAGIRVIAFYQPWIGAAFLIASKNKTSQR